MKKLLTKLGLLITGAAMAIGVGIVSFNNEAKEVNAAYSGVSPYTITMNDKSLMDATSYSSGTATISGIGLTFANVNPSNGQMKRDDSYIFNTTALPGKITNITLTYTSGTWTTAHAKVGIEAFTTDNAKTGTNEDKGVKDGDLKTISWDFSVDNAKFFTVFLLTGDSSGSGYYIHTLKITYEQTPTSIEFNGNSNPKTVFYVGDDFSTTGLIVDVNYANGGKETIVKDTDYTVSEPDLSSTGPKTVTISPKAGGKAVGCSSISYDITVNPGRELVSVTLTGDLTNKAYTIGDSWDLTGISLTGNYNDSTTENLGTLNSLITAEKVTFTLDPEKPALGGSTLDIKNLKYEGTYDATETLHITGITVSEKIRYVLFEEETITAGDYMLVTSDSYAVTNELTGNDKRILAANDFEITNNCIFEPDAKFSYTVAKDGDYYTFYNAAENKYLAGTVANESGFVESVNDYARWTVTRANGGYKLINKVVSGYLQKNSTINHYFGCYGNSTGFLGVLYLYKQLPPVVKVTVVDNKTTIGLGGSATITTELLNGAAYTATFSSDDPNGDHAVLTDNGDGTATLTAVSAGLVTVTTSALGCEDVETVFTIRDIALIEKIKVETQPDKIEYIAGEEFSSAGLSIEVTYSNGGTDVKTSGFVTSPVDMSTKGVKVVTVSYTEEEITRETSFEITVSYPSITVPEAIEIIKPLEKQTPTAETYRVTGKVVSKEWSGNSTEGYANINIAVKYNEQDPEKVFQIYHALQGDKDTFNLIQVGATIIVESKLQKYTKNDQDIYETVANPDIIDFDEQVGKLVTAVSIHREPDNKQYYVGDTEFDYSGTVMYIHYNTGSGDRETVRYDDDPTAFLEIFEFTDPDTSDSKASVPVTITHKETGFSDSFNVSVSDVKPSSISVTKNPTKTTYASGEEFEPDGIEVTVKNNNGSEFVADSSKLTYRTIAQDGKVYEGDTYVTVIYDNNNNLTKSIPITVAPKYITGISATLSEGWNDDTYDIGGTFNTKSLVIHVNYNDGSFDKYNSKNSDFSMFTITPPDMSTAGDKNVTITYTSGGDTFITTVLIHIKGVEELSIDQEPYRLVYRVGDELNLNGLKLTALYNTTDVEDVDPTWDNVTITGDTSKDGPNQKITFTYKGASASYEIDVWLTNTGREVLIKSEIAKLKNSVKASDYTDENWATVQDIISALEDSLSDYDASKDGQHYSSDVLEEIEAAKELIAAVPLKNITKIELIQPTKTTYNIGENLDLTGFMVIVYFENGTMRFVTADACTITGFDSSTAGTKTIKVTYSGFDAEFKVTVVDPTPVYEKTLENITISGPTKTTYEYGEELNTAGLVVTAHYSDNTTDTVTNVTVTGYNKNQSGQQTVTVSYTEGEVTKIATFTVTVGEQPVDPAVVEEARTEAIAELNDFFDSIDLSGYSAEVIAQFNAAKQQAMQTLGGAATEEEIATALANAKAALNALVNNNPKPTPTPTPEPATETTGASAGLMVLMLFALLAVVIVPIIIASGKEK